MSVRADILERLAKTPNRAAESVLEQALASASGHEQRQVVDLLLQRNQRAGWIALIRHFDRLSADDRLRLLTKPRDLFGPLAETMGDGAGKSRENAIAIVREAADPKLVSLLTDALIDTRPDVRELAGETLLEAVRRFRAGGSDRWAADLPEIRRAVEVAMRGFKTHRQTSAVVAALIFERQIDSPMWLVFNDQYADATRAANLVLRQLTDPAIAGGAFLALASPLKVAALSGIAGCEHPAMIEALIHQAFRLLDPNLRTAVDGIAHFKFFAEGRGAVRWEKENPIGWLGLIEGLNLSEPLRFNLIRRMLDNLSDAATVPVKMIALRALGAMQNPDVIPLLARLAYDPDVRVARCATRYVLRRKPSEWRAVAAELLQSPHAAVRQLISLVANNGRFDELWQGYQKLPPAVQQNSTRAAATSEADFGAQLKGKLGGSVAEVAQGLRMIGALKNLGPYRTQIIGLCAHSDSRVVSAAIKLIGRMEDPQFQDLLEAAARHSDTRVRANAIEAMEALHVAHTSKQVLAMLTSRHNRERANAIKAISKFDFSTAHDCLVKMLSDPNPLHRISALWVVSQLDMLDVIRQVGVMARKDSNLKVRNRADEILQTLHAVATNT